MADDVAVDDDLDRVALVLVELGRVGDVDHLAVDPDADEALPAGAVEDAVALGLAVLDQRPQHEQPGAFRQRQHLVDDLLDRLALDRVAVGTVRDADPGEQQPQVVVDLGDGADRGARVARGALLVDRDRRRQAVDLVDVRLLHLAQELAGVRAQALDVAALALGVDGVEGQARLARAGQSGDDDEAVARERDVHVLEVVFSCAAHDELILGHASSVRGLEANRTGVRGAVARRPGRAAGPCYPRGTMRTLATVILGLVIGAGIAACYSPARRGRRARCRDSTIVRSLPAPRTNGLRTRRSRSRRRSSRAVPGRRASAQ